VTDDVRPTRIHSRFSRQAIRHRFLSLIPSPVFRRRLSLFSLFSRFSISACRFGCFAVILLASSRRLADDLLASRASVVCVIACSFGANADSNRWIISTAFQGFSQGRVMCHLSSIDWLDRIIYLPTTRLSYRLASIRHRSISNPQSSAAGLWRFNYAQTNRMALSRAHTLRQGSWSRIIVVMK